MAWPTLAEAGKFLPRPVAAAAPSDEREHDADRQSGLPHTPSISSLDSPLLPRLGSYAISGRSIALSLAQVE